MATLALAGAALAWLALINGGRALRWRRRRRRSALRDPGGSAEVLTMWAEIEELLAWWGIRRRVSETFAEVAGRAGSHLGATIPATAPAEEAASGVSGSRPRSQLETLAGWASEADYGEGTLPPTAVAQARWAERQLALSLRRAASVRLRLRWLGDPRLAWRGTRRS
jgi:hypothetical protein